MKVGGFMKKKLKEILLITLTATIIIVGIAIIIWRFYSIISADIPTWLKWFLLSGRR